MSKESFEWLNQNVLVGFTEKRGNAWHYRASEQGDESNHYPGAIPQDDVLRRLFSWHATERPLIIPKLAEKNDGEWVWDSEDGELILDNNYKVIVRDDTHDILGIFKDSYVGHQYDEWLLNQVSQILDDDLQIGSAGLLRNGARAWLSVEVPDNIVTPEGVEFRPHLLSSTSFDGSLATTYKRCIQIVVCDNTLEAGLSEKGQMFKVRHSKYSGMRLNDARDALAIVHNMADDFSAQISEWTAEKVSDEEFDKFLNTLIEVPEEDGKGKTRAENTHSELRGMYKSDQRCAPWYGTAFGVIQTMNTYTQQVSTVRGDRTRAERNMDNVLSGTFASKDADVLKALEAVLN